MKIIFEHELADEPYQFDLVGVAVRESDNKLFWSTDAGCSCPCPWENHTDADWFPLPETLSAFLDAARAGRTDETEFVRLVREELAKRSPSVKREKVDKGTVILKANDGNPLVTCHNLADEVVEQISMVLEAYESSKICNAFLEGMICNLEKDHEGPHRNTEMGWCWP